MHYVTAMALFLVSAFDCCFCCFRFLQTFHIYVVVQYFSTMQIFHKMHSVLLLLLIECAYGRVRQKWGIQHYRVLLLWYMKPLALLLVLDK